MAATGMPLSFHPQEGKVILLNILTVIALAVRQSEQTLCFELLSFGA